MQMQPSSEVSVPTSRRRRVTRHLPVLAVPLLGAAVVAASLSLLDDASGADDGPSGLAGAAEELVWRNDPARLAALDDLRGQMQAGWVPFHGDPGVPGVEVPDDLWLRWDETSVERVALELPQRRAAVHQGRGGPVVGYYYADVGYIPAEMAATFDPEPIRAANDACTAAGTC